MKPIFIFLSLQFIIASGAHASQEERILSRKLVAVSDCAREGSSEDFQLKLSFTEEIYDFRFEKLKLSNLKDHVINGRGVEQIHSTTRHFVETVPLSLQAGDPNGLKNCQQVRTWFSKQIEPASSDCAVSTHSSERGAGKVNELGSQLRKSLQSSKVQSR
jgi:hypothetical protein